MKANVIIPARGGSKGIPHKNIVYVCGRPLIAWTISQALAATSTRRVIVSTDDHAIASIADRNGADIRWRPAETATDSATTESAIRDVLVNVETTPITVLLQCTSPIRQPGDIDNAVRLLVDRGYSSVFSARCVEGYIWNRSGDDWTRRPPPRLPRQLRGDVQLEENGSIYVFRTEAFMEHGRRLVDPIGVYEMHPMDSFQIDTPEDIPMLEHLIRERLKDACYRQRAI